MRVFFLCIITFNEQNILAMNVLFYIIQNASCYFIQKVYKIPYQTFFTPIGAF
jgi:hypothetical protein